MALTQEQLDIITRTVLGEARGEGELGMVAVAHNIRNRSLSGKFPDDPAKVALQPYQYSTWNKGEGGNNPQQFSPSSQQYQTARKLVEEVWGGSRPDPTNGALYYHTPQVNPNWAREVNRHGTTQVGNHIFYNGHPVPPREIPNVVASQTDTRRPQNIQGNDERPTSAISNAFPTRNATPRLSQELDGIYAYTPPDAQSAHIIGGAGSLTPDFFNRNVPLPQPRPSRAVAGFPTPLPNFAPGPERRLPEIAPPSGYNRIDAMAGIPSNVMRQELALQGQSYAGMDRAPSSGIGRPPATRSVASVPVPASVPRPTAPALSRDSVAQAQRGSYMARVMPNMRSQVAAAPMPTTAVPNAIPGPARVAQVSSRLPASQWGVPDALLAETGVIPPAVPDVGVASAMSVVPGFPPMPRNRPLRSGVNVQMPTPMGQRPTLPMPRSGGLGAIFGMPTPVSQRPNPNALRVQVNGAGSYSGGGSSGGSSGGSQPRFVMKGTGKEVTPQVIDWFNPDAPNGGAFEKRTVFR